MALLVAGTVVHHDDLSFHNVGELRTTSEGTRLQRLPEDVRKHLNEDARDRYLVPSGSEIRIVPLEESVEVSLSCPGGWARVRPFWGRFQAQETIEIETEPETIELSRPDELDGLDDANLAGGFSPSVARLRFDHHSEGTIYYHGAEGKRRPPRDEEVPDTTLLAYGTSITEGFYATGTHLSYPAVAACRLGVDHLNLGTAGSAHCEPELADHLGEREDWDFAVLSLSVNMLGDFTSEEFRERARYTVERVSETGRPVVAITLFPLRVDVLGEGDGAAPHREFRRILREVVADTDHEDVHLLEGPDLLGDPTGHTADVLHPGDHGMIEIGEGLADGIESLLD